MYLIIVKIPERLPNLVPDLLRRVGEQKILHVESVQPIHRQDATGREFGVVLWKNKVGNVGAGFRNFHRALQLQIIISFFQQLGFHLAHVALDVVLVQAEQSHGHRLHHFEVGADAVGHTGVLNLDRQFVATFGRQVYLPDGSSVQGRHLKGVKELARSFAKIILEGLDHQRARQRRRGVLRHLEAVHVGAGQHVAVHAQHLGHFEGRTFQFAEGIVNIRGVIGVELFLGRAGIDQLLDVVFQVVAANLDARRDKFRGAGNFGGGDGLLLFHGLRFWYTNLA